MTEDEFSCLVQRPKNNILAFDRFKIQEFNLGSRKQIGEYLQEFGWKPKKFTPTGQPIVDEGTLKTVEDIMLKDNAIPFVNENFKMRDALKILSSKKLGFLLIRDKKKLTKGIITDGELRRFSQKNQNLHNISVKEIMTKNPIGIDKNELAAKALSIMNDKKITSLCVYEKKNKSKTIGVLHIHNILQSNIS